MNKYHEHCVPREWTDLGCLSLKAHVRISSLLWWVFLFYHVVLSFVFVSGLGIFRNRVYHVLLAGLELTVISSCLWFLNVRNHSQLPLRMSLKESLQASGVTHRDSRYTLRDYFPWVTTSRPWVCSQPASWASGNEGCCYGLNVPSKSHIDPQLWQQRDFKRWSGHEDSALGDELMLLPWLVICQRSGALIKGYLSPILPTHAVIQQEGLHQMRQLPPPRLVLSSLQHRESNKLP